MYPMTDESDTSHPKLRKIRSFALRAGRITAAQQRALNELWPKYGLEASADSAVFNLDAIFGRKTKCTLEIGFGNGENLVGLAKSNPNRDFIGIEVHSAGVGHLLLEIEALRLTNVRVIRYDAVEVLQHCIAPNVLDEVLVLFPDPWHKKRHHKRRLIQPNFLSLIAHRLLPGGRLQLATDWEPYAVQMLALGNAHPRLINRAGTVGFMPRPEWRVLTRFERRGHRLGHGVWDLSFERQSNLD